VSSPTIDVDELVKPVSDDAPGGEPLADALRRDLDSWRKEPDPDFPDSSDLPPPEWGKIISAASDALARTGKDLTVAVRLVEALAKKHGTAGLRDGLLLLERLAADCWEYTHPVPEPGDDQEARRGRLEWLNDAGKGGRFPMSVLRMPVVKTARGDEFEYTAADWLNPDRRPEVLEAASGLTLETLRQAMGELGEVREVLKRLGALLDGKMGAESPNLNEDGDGNLGNALVKCSEFVRGLAGARGFSLDDGPPPEEQDTGGGGGEESGVPGGRAAGGSRDQMYRQLEQIAAGLRRLEPHSPVPYLIERCVRMGALPFPDLMREVLGQNVVLDEIDRLLGLTREG
jgi:type VI secretion system protein ImpA